MCPLPPAIIMGGEMGAAISVARSLGRQGVEVHFLGRPDSPERQSRYVRYARVQRQEATEEPWATYLLGPESDYLRGAVLLACSDRGIETIYRHRDKLAEKYTLDISNPAVQERLLNKWSTYCTAADAGIPTPLFWLPDTLGQLHVHKEEFVYPLIVKPLYSHRLAAVLDRKFLVAEDFDQLVTSYETISGLGIEVLLLEKIPGPDDRLCSYFTYMDESGEPLFHFTKRVIRRYPENEGLGCYHITDWNPEVRDLGLQLFTYAGLQGLGNVEFKRDERDGKLKVIECNARFTAANGLLAASGYDLGLLVYNRLVGRPQPALKSKKYREGMSLWYPARDFAAFLELRAKRRLSLRSWIASVLHPQVFVYFRWDDPLPSIMGFLRLPGRLAKFRSRERRSAGNGPAGF